MRDDRLFVYGTLKKGGRLHRHMAGAHFAGPARTLPLYTLWDLGAYPGMTPGGTTAISGELYLVPGDLWSHLDEVEGAPDLFERGPVFLEPPTPGESYPANAYFLVRSPWTRRVWANGIFPVP